MKWLCAFLCLFVSLTAFASACAQETTTGTLEGTVVDKQGASLPGVTVTLSSPQGPKTAVTDANGGFRFAQIPPGTYGLKAVLSGFNAVERQKLDVRLGSRVRIEIVLTPGVTETIEVIGTAPVVDLSTTTTGATLSAELISSVPVPRNFSGTLALAPGVVASGIPGAEDSNPSINGASGLENTYMVDGVNIGNTGFGSAGSFSYVFGTLGTGVNFDYIKEIQVKTGGYEPEFGEALGGYVNLVTKTGGNRTTGSLFTYYQSEDLEGDRATTDRENANFDAVSFETTDFGFEAGGPIVQDKAFWFAAFDPTFTTRTRRTPQAVRNASGFDHEMQVERTIYNYAANAKWFANPKHTFSISGFGDPSTGELGPQRDDALVVANPSTRFSKLTFGGHNVTGRWEGELLPDWFAEGSIGYHQDKFEEEFAVNQPQGIDNRPDVPVRYGGVGFFTQSDSWNLQYRLKLSNYVQARGEHNFRYGVELQDIHYDNTTSYTGTPGTVTLPDGRVSSSGFTWDISDPDTAVAGDEVFRINRIRVGELLAETKARYLAFYLSDSWSITKWLNVMAGVRYEQEELTGTLSDFKWDGNWAPRAHITLDPTKDNKTKLSFAYGRFYGKIPQDLAVRAMSSEVTAVINYPLTNVDLSDPTNPRVIDPNNIITDGFFTFGDSPTVIDPDAGLTYQDEYIASVEREVLPFFNVGVTYINRNLGRTLEDVALSTYSGILNGTEDFGSYFITNPSPEDGFPEPSRKYNAVTLKLDKRLHESWQMLGSYTWSRLEGNYEGYFRRENGQPDPFITSLFDFPYLKDPDIFKYLIEDGVLLNDRTHVFNLFGSYGFDFNLKAGLSFRVQSGIPKTKLGFHEVYSNDGEIALEERGASGRTPTTTDVGVHLDYPLTLGGSNIDLILDVFNIFNGQKEQDYEHNFERGGAINPALGGGPFPEFENPDFGKPVVFQQPRQIRFAARTRF